MNRKRNCKATGHNSVRLHSCLNARVIMDVHLLILLE